MKNGAKGPFAPVKTVIFNINHRVSAPKYPFKNEISAKEFFRKETKTALYPNKECRPPWLKPLMIRNVHIGHASAFVQNTVEAQKPAAVSSPKTKPSMFQNIREYENMHIALWLVKDACWVSDFKIAGMIMIIPTILVAIHITWRSRKVVAELFHNLAVCLWICANGTWMTGEFFYNDGLRPFAMAFFFTGIITVAIYYAVYFPNRKEEGTVVSNDDLSIRS